MSRAETEEQEAAGENQLLPLGPCDLRGFIPKDLVAVGALEKVLKPVVAANVKNYAWSKNVLTCSWSCSNS